MKQINLYKIQGDDFIKTENTKRIASLVTEIQNGNKRAFDELYNLTKERAYFVAIQFVKNEDDVQDILQESYIKALSKIKELDKPESFQSWLNQIVANKSKDFLKKKKPMLFEAEENEVYEVLPDEDLNFRPEDSLDQSELQRTVMEVLDELNEEKRACVMMMYFEELSVSEIAQTLEIPEGTVKTRLFSARKDLKEKFSKRGITSAYSVAPIGVVLWAMRKSCITAGAAFASSASSATVLAGVSAASASTAATASTATTVATAVTAKASGGIGAKIMAMSLAKKIVAGVAAVAVIGGTTAGVVTVANKNNGTQKAETEVYQESYEEHQEIIGDQQEGSEFMWNAKRYKSGYFIYVLNLNGEAAIVECDSSASGEVVIPDSLDGHTVKFIGTFDKNDIAITLNLEETIQDYSYIFPFMNCKHITSLVIPSTVEFIPAHSLKLCESLVNITVDKNNPYFSSDENGVMYNKEKTALLSYPSGKTDKHYKVSDDITEIGDCSFMNAKSLETIDFNENIKTIGSSAFKNCKGLEKIIFPTGIEKIGSSAFIDCSNLKLIYVPKSVNYIDGDAFMGNAGADLYYEGSIHDFQEMESYCDLFSCDIHEYRLIDRENRIIYYAFDLDSKPEDVTY